MKKTAILVVVIIFLANFPPVNWLAGPDDIAYSNAKGSFTFDEVNDKGRNYKLCLDIFQAFKSVNKEDTILYRITSINVFYFWRWEEYLTNKKYKLAYKSWKEIESIRGPIKNKTNWQAF